MLNYALYLCGLLKVSNRICKFKMCVYNRESNIQECD